MSTLASPFDVLVGTCQCIQYIVYITCHLYAVNIKSKKLFRYTASNWVPNKGKCCIRDLEVGFLSCNRSGVNRVIVDFGADIL